MPSRLLHFFGLTPGLERRVTALERWRTDHERDVQERELRHEADIQRILQYLGEIDDAMKADRLAHAELGPLNTAAVLEGFKETAAELVRQIMARDRAAHKDLMVLFGRVHDRLEALEKLSP